MAVDPDVIEIRMQTFETKCCLCGRWQEDNCGVPISAETGLVAANDDPGPTGGRPACRRCHDRHAGGAFVGTDPRF